MSPPPVPESSRLANLLQGRATDRALALWYALVVVFLFAPILCALVYAFNLGIVGKQTSTFTGWTLQWFPAAWHDTSLRRAVGTSLVVSFWSALISVLVGTALGYALIRHPSPPVRRLLSAITYFLLIVPESVIGVSSLLFYAVTAIRLSSATLVAGITPVAIAVVALIVRARVLTLDRRVEEAAADLGSTRAKTLRFIVLPQMLPAILASAVMAYTFSFDNLVISTFLTTPRLNTLPVYLYGSLQYGPAPTVYAAASVVFLFTLAMLGVAFLLFRLTSRRPRGSAAL
ncbi:spermidine/putrescine transport system permease protein/putrescine transport system permease protein [Faunimonas pinastri]|uniref:Spermidine/putrescine transport system permease protein/putrescine transport system permease protein n=1 Tax=Faunimonas pinastri TaxID=1855383 RepID=A0A1H9K3H2_9HYPH|nr:ABC transporter permease [Faunimonas pinastri]SEQ93694.1 spermidine/putrescine transport system permease protein/putrescine transport system permease protein [Faunimonas pinastri]